MGSGIVSDDEPNRAVAQIANPIEKNYVMSPRGQATLFSHYSHSNPTVHQRHRFASGGISNADTLYLTLLDRRRNLSEDQSVRGNNLVVTTCFRTSS